MTFKTPDYYKELNKLGNMVKINELYSVAMAERERTLDQESPQLMEAIHNIDFDLEKGTSMHYAPLLFAVDAQSPIFVRELLAKGANPEAIHPEIGMTALDYAKRELDIVTKLGISETSFRVRLTKQTIELLENHIKEKHSK